MKIPFTEEQFFELFAQYNQAVFPMQILLILIGITCAVAIRKKKTFQSKLTGYFLAATWIWIGVVYHLLFFTSINIAAYGFGLIFILQGLFFIREMVAERLKFSETRPMQNWIAYSFILFALFIYPLISFALIGEVENIISLGLPCPTTILTFGFLLLTIKLPKYLLILPTLWAMIGTWAAIDFGVYQDYVMTLSALVALYLLVVKKGTDGDH